VPGKKLTGGGEQQGEEGTPNTPPNKKKAHQPALKGKEKVCWTGTRFGGPAAAEGLSLLFLRTPDFGRRLEDGHDEALSFGSVDDARVGRNGRGGEPAEKMPEEAIRRTVKKVLRGIWESFEERRRPFE